MSSPPRPDLAAIRERLERVALPWSETSGEEVRDANGRTVKADGRDHLYNFDLILHAPADIRALLAHVERLEMVLADETGWRPDIGGIIAPIAPGHGSCCTCQDCGRPHDECVCQHNRIEAALAGPAPEKEGERG